ncbi:MAG: hypothetical protein ABSH34_12540 [Verrucomicrobiota bacterium]|jgi:hypothetical protein
MMISVLSPLRSCAAFLINHPGILLVRLGAAGEVISDWREMRGPLARLGKLSAIVLIVGLCLEFWEAAKSDNEVASLKVEAVRLESTNRVTALRVEELRSTDLVLQARALNLEKQVEELHKSRLALEKENLELQKSVDLRDIGDQFSFGMTLDQIPNIKAGLSQQCQSNRQSHAGPSHRRACSARSRQMRCCPRPPG